jgi:uncharacterized protein YunC (DUF1805 family)
MTHEEAKVLKQSGKYRIVLADSATSISEANKNDIFVDASHCGENVGRYAVQGGVKGMIGNDAGKGMEDAGVAGFKVLDEKGIPGAAVSANSAEIGVGITTWDSGVISTVNKAAQKIGVKPGMTAKQAAEIMLQAAVKAGK